MKSSEVNLKSSEVDLKSSEVGGGRSLKLRVSTKKETRLFFSYDFQIFIFGEKFTSPTRNDDRGGNFFFQKLVSDDLKWSEMPKKHDF